MSVHDIESLLRMTDALRLPVRVCPLARRRGPLACLQRAVPWVLTGEMRMTMTMMKAKARFVFGA